MRFPSTRRGLTALGIVVAVALVATGVGVYALANPSTGRTSVALAIVQNSTTGSYGFGAPTIRVPHATAVDFTITNWDPMSHGVPTRYMTVSGTMAEMMVYMGGGMGGHMQGEMMSSLPSYQISHTFTIMMGGYDLNIPIPVAPSPSTPSVVTFTIQIGGPGTYSWSCMGAGMGAMSGMAGMFLVS